MKNRYDLNRIDSLTPEEMAREMQHVFPVGPSMRCDVSFLRFAAALATRRANDIENGLACEDE